MCKTISFYYLFIVLATLFLVVSGDASPFISDDEIKNKGLDKVLDAINQLIREHKDTYDNPEVLENFSNAIKNSEESMKKKEEEEEEKPEIVEEEKEEEEKPEVVEEEKEEEEEEEDDDDGDNDKNKGINDTLDAINKLIREHKDTYDRPEVLEKFSNAIKNSEESMKKKEEEEEEEKPEIVEEEKEEEQKPEIVEEKKEEEEEKHEIVEEKKEEEEQKPEIVEEKKEEEEQKPEIVEEEKEEDDDDDDKNKGINDTLDAINKLILEHKDTYDRPEVLENFANAIKNREESLKKKENEKLKRRLY